MSSLCWCHCWAVSLEGYTRVSAGHARQVLPAPAPGGCCWGYRFRQYCSTPVPVLMLVVP